MLGCSDGVLQPQLQLRKHLLQPAGSLHILVHIEKEFSMFPVYSNNKISLIVFHTFSLISGSYH